MSEHQFSDPTDLVPQFKSAAITVGTVLGGGWLVYALGPAAIFRFFATRMFADGMAATATAAVLGILALMVFLGVADWRERNPRSVAKAKIPTFRRAHEDESSKVVRPLRKAS